MYIRIYVCVCIYIYIYIYTHAHAHVTLHPITMLKMSGAKAPSPYVFTACTGTILATVTENFFHGFETVGNLKVAAPMPLGFRIFCRSPSMP